MVFLNPLLLLLLPAALLPVLIHLLNRLRYRTVPWAAVMFLVAATRSSVRRARVRQILVLLARMLVILFLVLALARPVLGGWLGLGIAGRPDTILVLLDRSAGMSAIHPHRRISKRETALKLFEEAGGLNPGRAVFIENVLCRPQTLASLSGLRELSLCAPTDTAADIPAMLDSAIEYMVASRAGRTEIWLASDLQRSNWHPDRGTWQSLNARLAAMPQDVILRVLDLSGESRHNISLSFSDFLRHGSAEGDLVFDITGTGGNPGAGRLPLVMALNGVRTAFDQELSSASVRCVRRINLPSGGEGGSWGRLIAPPDGNPRDNTLYFACGDIPDLRAIVLAEYEAVGRILQLSCAPAPDFPGRACTVAAPDAWSPGSEAETGLLVWQGELPGTNLRSRLSAFVEAGGNVLYLPPAAEEFTGGTDGNGSSSFGLRWADRETAHADSAFRVALWEENEGPLAGTLEGHALPLGEMACYRRARMTVADGLRDHWQTIAEFSDGAPLCARRLLGRGAVYAWATLPAPEWSTWGEGAVLVPMMQRLMLSGSRRLGNVEDAICGEWAPREDDTWLPAGEESGDVRWNAGVYRRGRRLLVLNRPPEEDLPECIPPGSIADLLPDVRVRVVEDLAARSDMPARSEVWWLVLCGATAFMAIESALLLQRNIRQPSAGRAVVRE